MVFLATSLLARLYSRTLSSLTHSTLLSKNITNFRKFHYFTRNYCLVPNAQLTVDNAHKYWLEAFIRENVPEPLSSIEHILVYVLGYRNVSILGCKKDTILSPEKILLLNKLAKQRFARVPVQYIIQEWDFLELTLKMSPPVFIPRPETESLVIIASSLLNSQACKSLEIGPGTGAISLALLNRHEQLCCTAIDASLAATNLSRHNAELLQLKDRIEIINAVLEDDGFTGLPSGFELKNQFDLVVSNPPYIPTQEVPNLDPGIVLFEDKLALDGGNIDGTRTIEMILKQSPSWLKPGGFTVLEIDPRQVSKIEAIVNELDTFCHFQVWQDTFHVDRFISVQLK